MDDHYREEESEEQNLAKSDPVGYAQNVDGEDGLEQAFDNLIQAQSDWLDAVLKRLDKLNAE